MDRSNTVQRAAFIVIAALTISVGAYAEVLMTPELCDVKEIQGDVSLYSAIPRFVTFHTTWRFGIKPFFNVALHAGYDVGIKTNGSAYAGLDTQWRLLGKRNKLGGTDTLVIIAGGHYSLAPGADISLIFGNTVRLDKPDKFLGFYTGLDSSVNYFNSTIQIPINGIIGVNYQFAPKMTLIVEANVMFMQHSFYGLGAVIRRSF